MRRPPRYLVDHVQLAMPPGGEEAARGFYGGLLGLGETEKPPPLRARGGCWFEGPDVRLHLGVEPGFSPSSKAHPGLRVADLPALLDTLAAGGVLPETGRTPDGEFQAYVHDPFGNRLELLELGTAGDPALALETPRLHLRRPRAEDYAAYKAFVADAEVMTHLGGAQRGPMAWRGFASIIGAWTLNGFSMFSVIEKDTGRWIGRVGPWRPEGWPGNEVGWAFVREVWGRGFATEAAQAAVDWCFETLGWEEVIHCISADNAASIALAERLGSRRLRHARLPEPISAEIEVYGQSRADWEGARP